MSILESPQTVPEQELLKKKASGQLLNPRDISILAAHAAWDKKATDIVILNVAPLVAITDFFVIVSGANPRQVDAIQESVEQQLRETAGIKPIGREGTTEKTWVLLDYGDIVVHIFQPQTREFYRLESIWNDAQMLDLAAEGIVQPQYETWLAGIVAKS